MYSIRHFRAKVKGFCGQIRLRIVLASKVRRTFGSASHLGPWRGQPTLEPSLSAHAGRVRVLARDGGRYGNLHLRSQWVGGTTPKHV